MIKGIFFDVGGTLYSYSGLQPALVSALGQLGKRLELEHDAQQLEQHYMQASKAVDKIYAPMSFYLVRDYMEAIFSEMLGRIEQAHQRHHYDWFEPVYRELTIGGMELKPDCHDTLAQLKARGLYLSAVSNADENQLQPLVERGELHRWLTHWTSSEAAQSCKPDRRFFEIALDKAQLDPREILFVGDSLEQDILGAHAMGMSTALITEFDGHAPMHIGREVPEPDFRITHLSELLPIVDKLNRAAA